MGLSNALILGVPAFLAAVVCSTHGQAAEGSDSVLGLEPGTHRLCNDDIGVILWGPDSAPTLSIGKSDVWDRRLPPTEEPVLTLAEMMRMAREGDPAILDGAPHYTAYNSYDFPCPKPVGQLILLLPFLETTGTLSFEPGKNEAVLVASAGVKQLRLRIFVSSVRNLIAMRGHAQGLEPGDVAIRLWRHCDTIEPGGELHPTLGRNVSPEDFEPLPAPRAGSNDTAFWIAQDFGAEKTFPDGFSSVLACRVVGAGVQCEALEGTQGLGTPMIAEKEGRLSHGLYKRFTPINEAPGAAVTATPVLLDGDFDVLAAIVTTQDSVTPRSRAFDLLQEAEALGAEALWEEHRANLAEHENRPHARAWAADGSIAVDAPWGGVPNHVRPAGYYGDVPLCSVDSTKFCFQDSGRWHADFHFNEVDATGPCILRQYDLLAPYYDMIYTMLPMAQANAREVYGCAGAMYPLVHYPLKAERVIHVHVTWEQSIEITALLARPFWLRFLYTWDTAFLRDKAYPVLREGARFYAAFLERGEDGLYHVFPTVSPEHRGITRNLEFNRDSQSGITLIRYHLRAAARAARLLGLDGEEAGLWESIAERMPPYPTIDTAEGRIFIDVAGAEPIEYNIAVPLTAVFWGDDIGLDSPPEQIELTRRTLEAIDVWEPHQGYLKSVRRRLGIYRAEDGMTVENLLQSYTGVIRVFPAVPADFEGGFANLGAQGAFVVGAERTKDGVKSVTVHSLAGNPCVFANPWPETQPGVQCVETGDATRPAADAGLLRFDTEAERTYLITPSGMLAESYTAVPDATVWPNLTRLPDGTILMAGFDKPSHGQVEGDVACWASVDEGLTWSLRGLLTKHEPQTNRMNQAVGLDRHGNLIALVSGWTDVQQPGAPKKGAFRDAILPTWTCRSSDGGKAWRQSEGFPYTDPSGSFLVPFGDILVSDGGRLNAAAYSSPGYPNEDAWGACFFVSDDDGDTWQLRSRIAQGLNETALLYLGNGEWLAAARGKGKGVFLLRSTDDGMTWENEGEGSEPYQHPAHLLQLKDGRILLSYGDRRPGHFGVGARLSPDKGKTWGAQMHLASMPDWDGGYPASVEREDGRILTVFYAKAAGTYSVQAVVWDVSD